MTLFDPNVPGALQLTTFGRTRGNMPVRGFQAVPLAVLAAAAGWAGSAGLASAQSPSSDEVRAVVAEMLADAESRSSLLGDDADAGHDSKGFFIADPASGFRLNIGGYMQARYYANWRDDAPNDDDFTNGFQLRRTRISINGTAADPNLRFALQGDFNRATGVFVLTDAYGDYKFENGWHVRFGQFKPQLLRDENVPATRLLAVERSVVNAVFTQGRTQGVGVWREFESWKVSANFGDGLRTNNTDFTNSGSVPGGEADWALTARAEWKSARPWSDYNDFNSFRGSDFGLMIGGGLHYQSGGDTGGPTADTDLFEYTADVNLLGDGWTVYGAFVGRHLEGDAVGSESFDDFGVIVHGGVFVTERTELFARWDVVIPDGDRPDSNDPFTSVAAGVNYFFIPKSHAAKFTADVVWFPDSQADSSTLISPNTGIGLLADSPGQDGQFLVRLQFQLIF